MPTVIKPKYSVTPSSIPTAGALVEGEIAINAVDGRLFIRDNASNVVEVGLQPAGNPTFSSVDINGGTIDGTVIGGTVKAAVSTTSLVADTADINAGTIDNTVIGATTPAAGSFTTASTTGLATLASVDINGGNIDGTAIGATSASTGAFTTASTTGLATLASVDINGGNIDGTAIGAASASTGVFTTVDATTDISLADSVPIKFGTGDDYQLEFNGTHFRFTTNVPTANIQYYDSVNATTRVAFDMDTGDINTVTGAYKVAGTELTTGFTYFRSLTQATYDGLTPDANTIYFING